MMRVVLVCSRVMVLLFLLVGASGTYAAGPVAWSDLGPYLETSMVRINSIQGELRSYLNSQPNSGAFMLVIMAELRLQAAFNQLVVFVPTVEGLNRCNCTCPLLWLTVARNIWQLKQYRDLITKNIPDVTNLTASVGMREASECLDQIYRTVLEAIPQEHQNEVTGYLDEMPETLKTER
jgi:hypothetical protein